MEEPKKTKLTEAFQANNPQPPHDQGLPQTPPAEEQETTGTTFEQAMENLDRLLANDPEMQAKLKAMPPPITGWYPDLDDPANLDQI